MTTAGIWLRVSNDDQSEDNQLPDLERWCREHGYAVGPIFRVHGKSAWKPGKLDKDKRAVVEAFKAGAMDVLVVWSVDRWSRAGIADVVDGLKMVRDANGRVEFVKDEILNSTGDVQELLLAVLAWVARWESEHKSDRVKNGQARVRAEGGVNGNVPFGWKLVSNRKVAVEDELNIVREVFDRSARGESARTIAAWMTSAGFPRSDKTVGDLLRHADYVADGVVSGALAKLAVDALEGRRCGETRLTSEPDYSAMVFCPCGLRMWRTFCGGNGKTPRTRYYQCRNHAAKPKPQVRADDADVLIEQRMSSDLTPWMIPHRVGGDTRDADIAKTWKAIEQATKRRDMAEVMRLQAELPLIEARKPVPEHVEWIASDKTRGQRWDELTIPERRAWLDSEDTQIVLWPSKNDASVRKLWNVTADRVPGALTHGNAWMIVDEMDDDEQQAA